MAAPTKPTLVLVHGSWHSPAHFEPLITYLESHGYRCVAPELPSIHFSTVEQGPKDLQADITAIRTSVIDVLDSGSNVVVVAHSYGGVPTQCALDGLDHASRESANTKPNTPTTSVLALAYLCAFILPPGITLLDAIGGSPGPIHDVRGPLLHFADPPGPIRWFFHDLPHPEAEKWAALLVPQFWASYLEKTTPHPAYLTIPLSYLMTEKDQALVIELQRLFVEGARQQGAEVRVEVCGTAHSPHLSAVERTGEFVRRSAGEDVGQ